MFAPTAPIQDPRVQSGEQGQALVEAAFILPAMVLLLLLTIQLTQLQQARIMVEYAAFSAARAGIVQNGNNGSTNGLDGPMHDAALLALLPSFGRADSWTHLLATEARFRAEDLALRPFGLSQVRVDVHNPIEADFAALGQHLDGQEIDFDDVRPAAAEATLLSVQVRYLYELRVPFANKLIQTIWLASQKSNPSAPKLVAAGALKRYYLPVEAFYTMRMQSNPFLRWAHR